MPSVYDVARRAGVSIATASRVLSGSPYPVRDETRQRVLDAAKALNFRTNRLARALATAKTSTIGAIVHDVSDPYFAEILRGLEDAARVAGYQVFACSSDRDDERELEYVEALLSHHVQAMVFAGGGLEVPSYQKVLASLLSEFRINGGAVVVLAPHAMELPSITPENHGGAAAMTRMLADLGHRRIAFVTGPPRVRTSIVRLDGYRAGLTEVGIPFDDELVVEGAFTSVSGAMATAELLVRTPDITAIFAANDVMALGVLSELASRSIRVPQDMSVVGFDDIQTAMYVHPPLTTFKVPMYDLGREGARMVFALLEGETVASRSLPGEVIQRGTSGPPRRGRLAGKEARSAAAGHRGTVDRSARVAGHRQTAAEGAASEGTRS